MTKSLACAMPSIKHSFTRHQHTFAGFFWRNFPLGLTLVIFQVKFACRCYYNAYISGVRGANMRFLCRLFPPRNITQPFDNQGTAALLHIAVNQCVATAWLHIAGTYVVVGLWCWPCSVFARSVCGARAIYVCRTCSLCVLHVLAMRTTRTCVC